MYIFLFIIIIIVLILFFNKSYKIEKLTIMNKQNEIDADKYAMRAICEKRGHIWVDGPDDQWDCVYTKDTCLKTSKYPIMENDTPNSYLEWRDNPGKCIMGNASYRSFCEEEGLTYDSTTGTCKTNKMYCLNRLLPFCNGDCYTPPLQYAAEQIFGKTASRIFGFISPEMAITQGVCK